MLKFTRHIALLILISMLQLTCTFSQNNTADSLKKLLGNTLHDTARINILIELSWENLGINTDSSLSYSSRALALANKIKWQKGIANAYNNMGGVYYFRSETDTALILYNKALELRKKINDLNGASDCIGNIGLALTDIGKYDDALKHYDKQLTIVMQTRDDKRTANCYNNIGNTYYYMGEFYKTISYYIKSLKIQEKIGNKKGIATSYNNIGLVHYEQQNYKTAMDYYLKSLKISEELGDIRQNAKCYNNIGNLYLEQGNKFMDEDKKLLGRQHLQSATRYYTKSIEIKTILNDKGGIGISMMNIGSAQLELSDFNNAEQNLQKALQIFDETGDPHNAGLCLGNISELYLKKAQQAFQNKNADSQDFLNKAILYGTKAIKIADSLKAIPLKNASAENLMEVYKLKGDFKNAFTFSESFIETKDSMYHEEKSKALIEMETKYKAEKNKLQIDKLNSANKIKEIENKRQKLIIASIIAGLIMVLIFTLIIINRLRITKKQKRLIENQKDEIEAQRDIVISQKKQIELIHEELKDSIVYAERIQTAIMPGEEIFKKCFSESFILNMPRDIVSGDFYWAINDGCKTFFAVADCTGHGVPGALMSMMGVSFLNEIIAKTTAITSGQILDELRTLVINSLKQNNNSDSVPSWSTIMDGMDISLCIFNHNTSELQFSGANNSAILISNNDKHATNLIADRQPIGFSDQMKPFETYVTTVKKGDTLYLFSDGFEDQFGGPKGKKFSNKQLSALITDISFNRAEEQKHTLAKTLFQWQNPVDGKAYEQTDDIIILGIIF